MAVTYSPGGLDKAIFSGRLQQIKYMLPDREDVSHLCTTSGESPLVLALRIEDDIQRTKVFNYLLHRGAAVSRRDPQTGRNALAWACFFGHADQVRRLLQFAPGEFNLREPDAEGMLVIHHAVNSGNPFVVYYIVNEMAKYGVSVDVANSKDGMTPLLMAKRLGYELISQILLSEGKACPTQFDVRTFRTKTRWSEIGREERNKADLRLMISELRINGSTRPHTCYQIRRDRSHQMRRPKTSNPGGLQSTGYSDYQSVSSDSGIQSPGSASSPSQTPIRHPPNKEMFSDLQIMDLKKMADGKVRVSDIQRTRLSQHGDQNKSHSTGSSSGLQSTNSPPSEKRVPWTKLSNLMSLSDKASVVSTDMFASSKGAAPQTDHTNMENQEGAFSYAMIPSMMSALSQQMSTAFRKPAVPKPKEEPKPKPLPKKRKKGSTLAFILKSTPSKQSRRTRPQSRNTVASRSLENNVKLSRGQNRSVYTFGHRSSIGKGGTISASARNKLPAIKT